MQAHAGLRSASEMPAAAVRAQPAVYERVERVERAPAGTELLQASAPVVAPLAPAAAPVQAVKLAAPVRTAAKPKSQLVWMEVTAYCACTKCCGDDAQGITASGKTVKHNRGRFVAADTKYFPFGTKLSIPDYHGGRPVEVIDRGGDIKGNRLDVFFPRHSDALEFGRRWVKVAVVEKK